MKIAHEQHTVRSTVLESDTADFTSYNPMWAFVKKKNLETFAASANGFYRVLLLMRLFGFFLP